MTDQQAPTGLRTLTLGALLNQQFEPREHLLTPWLRSGESALLWAQSGAGKTLLALTVALAVAGGGEFLGWRSPRPRKVLLVDGEMDMEDLKDRLAFLASGIAGFDPEAARTNLVILSRMGQACSDTFPDLADATGRAAMLAEVERYKPDLVILDNLSTLANLPDENDAAAIAPISGFLLDLKLRRFGVILIHHSARGGGDYRGSSRIASTFEAILGLVVGSDRDASRGARFTLVWRKYRREPDASLRQHTVQLNRREDGTAEWRDDRTVDESVMAVVRAVRSRQHVSQMSIADALGISKGTVTKRRDAAISACVITRAEWDDCLGAGRAHGDAEVETENGARTNDDF